MSDYILFWRGGGAPVFMVMPRQSLNWTLGKHLLEKFSFFPPVARVELKAQFPPGNTINIMHISAQRGLKEKKCYPTLCQRKSERRLFANGRCSRPSEKKRFMMKTNPNCKSAMTLIYTFLKIWKVKARKRTKEIADTVLFWVSVVLLSQFPHYLALNCLLSSSLYPSLR